jgi:spermidine synthase
MQPVKNKPLSGLILLFIGFISILGQVALLRELAVAFFGSELIYLLAIAFWLVWTGLGALLSRRIGTNKGLLACVAALGFALPLEVVFARGVRLIFGATPGAFMPFEQQLIAMAATLAPAGLLLGYLFVQAARRHVTRGGSFATAYGLESLGGVLGGLASTFLLAGHLATFPTIILCSALTFFIGSLLTHDARSARFLFALTTLASLSFLFFAGNAVDRATLRWQFPGLLDSRDSPYGRLTMTERGGQLAVFENGALSFETQGTEPEEIAHLALLAHENPRRILLLGGGVSGTVREILKHRPEKIDYIELDPFLIELAQAHLPNEIRNSLQAPPVNLIISDGRKFLRSTTNRYDVIIVDMPEPTSGGTNRYYTREFFAACARVLIEDGLIAFRLPSSEQYWTPGLARRNTSIYRAAKSIFSDIIVLPGGVNTFLASNTSLSREPIVSVERLLARQIKTRLILPPYINYLYTNDRFTEIEQILNQTIAPVNSDLKPVCYQLTLLLWLSKFYYELSDFQTSAGSWLWWLLLPLLALFWIVRRRAVAAAKLLLVILAGFAGMVIEFAVLLRFQTASGVLFQDIGLLLAGFMAGLAVSPLPGKWAARTRTRGYVLALSLVLLCGASMLIFHWEGMRYTIVGIVWLFFAGAVVGSFFCYATEKTPDKGGALYAADLLGGSFGALMASLLLLPSLGLDTSALWMGLLALLGLLLI